MAEISIKRGDTFILNVSLKDEAGQPIALPVDKLRSHVRDSKDVLLANLSISAGATSGQYVFRAPSTLDWPVGSRLNMDLEMDIDGSIRSSETVGINVIKDVTHDG